jgi:dTDP-4-dehydrorhamnose reductase
MTARRGSVIVTGANGQLGQPLCALLVEHGYMVHRITRAKADLLDPQATLRVLGELSASTIFHCAAMTAVDACESEQDQAYAVNAHGTRGICRAARKLGSKVIYISTDYVFDGRNADGYDEFADPNPQSIYGRSKYFGEQVVLAQSPENVVVRVSWLFGPHGRNFVQAILNRASLGKDLTIISDQIGRPTYAPELAEKLIEINESKLAGLVHVSGSGDPLSWLDFGREAIKQAGLTANVKGTTTKEYGSPAPRPHCSVLRSRVLSLYGLAPCRPWKDGLADYITAMDGRF